MPGRSRDAIGNNRLLGREFPEANKIFFEEGKLGDQSAEDYRTVNPIQALETSDLWVLPRSLGFKDLSCPVETEL